ncbi:DUF4271 domain-containing protein [Halosquirtibacter laminarini]|uniref:DUF4271 domain-containing protein n=1 Tax=Halosquirtibacter laminarini TaxID=3374600 RepID=A0AC61NEG2_9BACT|nr:DUF4271 domain-containing protein [Prolixibacteraceae bacterium]
MLKQDKLFTVDSISKTDSVPFNDNSTVITVLPIRKEGLINHIGVYENISFGILLVCFIILASVRIIFPKYLNSIFQSLIYGGVAERIYRENPYRIGNAAFRLDFLSWFMISFFGVEVLTTFSLLPYSKTTLLGFMLLFTALYSFIRYYLFKLISWIFDISVISDAILFNNALFIKLIGVILLILNICIVYVLDVHNQLIYISLGVLVISFFFMFFRSIFVLLRKHFSIFYLILYLCTLEILPILLISKWLLG